MIKYLDQEQFYSHFHPLIAEIQCGNHYNPNNEQHVNWLKRKVNSIYSSGGVAICFFSQTGDPAGFLFLIYDSGLEDVQCFGKMASISMFGLYSQYRYKGIGEELLQEAESFIKRNGGECLYVDTYAGSKEAIRSYVKQGFTPVAYHPGVHGLSDQGQVYLYKEI